MSKLDLYERSLTIYSLKQSFCPNHDDFQRNCWIPIGWARISELVQMVQADSGYASRSAIDFPENEEDMMMTVADVAAPYLKQQTGPTWWCHVAADHPHVNMWLSNAQWLHPAISIALRDETRLISDKMRYLLYEVPVIVAGGLLFELLGQSAGDPYDSEDDIPIVLRSWQSQNFLVTSLHVKGSSSNLNVLGIQEIQELLSARGNGTPQSIHEVIAQLASRLARWDNRLFRKSIFGVADEVELKFMDRRSHEKLHLLSIILNQEIRRLSTQDRSLRITHNLGVIGGVWPCSFHNHGTIWGEPGRDSWIRRLAVCIHNVFGVGFGVGNGTNWSWNAILGIEEAIYREGCCCEKIRVAGVGEDFSARGRGSCPSPKVYSSDEALDCSF